MQHIALIGSSGGGAATLSGGSAYGAITTLVDHLNAAGFRLSHLQFVDCARPLDLAGNGTKAKLWQIVNGAVTCTCAGTLSDINEACAVADAKLATAIIQTPVADGSAATGGVERAARLLRSMRMRSDYNNNNITREGTSRSTSSQLPVDGMIVISADVGGANKESIAAAVASGLPIAGTGGTSIGEIMALGANVVDGGGSVATTPATRAMKFTTTFARELSSSSSRKGGRAGLGGYTPPVVHVHLHSVLNGTLPAFMVVYVAVATTKLVVKHGGCAGANSIYLERLVTLLDVERRAPQLLATVVTAVSAEQACGLGAIGTLAGALAGGCLRQSVVAALLTGIATGHATRQLLSALYYRKYPATAATITASGIAGQ